ncbi:MAG: chemotaxis protein CheD [Nannocystaceae bacterium]
MSTRLVQIGQLVVSADPQEKLKSVGLGSCVAVIVMDAVRNVVAMAHVVLPRSSASDPGREKPPAYYADKAIPELLRRMAIHGSSPKTGPLSVKLTGGASLAGQTSTFNIGKRNILAVKRCLWRHGLTPIAEDVGGTDARTVTAEVASQRVVISTPYKEPADL